MKSFNNISFSLTVSLKNWRTACVEVRWILIEFKTPCNMLKLKAYYDKLLEIFFLKSQLSCQAMTACNGRG